jgi:hypothetical protein
MDGTTMEPNVRYLLRIDKKQVPVIYDGWALWSGHGGEEGRKTHAFTRLDTGEWIFKNSARAVSKHYDDCIIPVDGPGMESGYLCRCRARLEAVGREAPPAPAPAELQP